MSIAGLSLGALLWNIPAQAQSQSPAGAPEPVQGAASAPAASTPAQQQANPQPEQPLAGAIQGTVLDQSGGSVVGASVELTGKDASQNQKAQSDDTGQFSFSGVAPGAFQLTVAAPGFASQTISGTLAPGQVEMLPPVTLAVAANTTQVQVVVTQEEIAEDQLQQQEKQRVLGVLPNFYVSYIPNAAPLDSRQKFQLAWKTLVDPITLGLTAGVAGMQQEDGQFSGFGTGAQGYGKRFGAAYADLVSGTVIGSAILPSILKQDPRFFYRGSGTKKSRFFYALANAVICKGDNGRWQPNYSSILGSLAAGGISNLYYPTQNRNGVALTFENTLIGIGASAVGNVLEEFLVPKLTKNFPKGNSSKS